MYMAVQKTSSTARRESKRMGENSTACADDDEDEDDGLCGVLLGDDAFEPFWSALRFATPNILAVELPNRCGLNVEACISDPLEPACM